MSNMLNTALNLMGFLTEDEDEEEEEENGSEIQTTPMKEPP
ncbi:MAG TPA: hypothetical protein VFC58_10705 [Desulfosporosinus sp.]|nr:hypothetical protein [Desulfosporosinus sp.]